MIIESVAAASAILSSINGLIKQVNETGSGAQQLMGTISDFGEALTNFEIERKSSTFKPLSQNDLFKITQLRKQQERYWKDIHDLLVALDPELLEDFERAKAEQEVARQKHMAMLAKKRKEREKLKQQITVGLGVFIVGGGISVGLIYLVIRMFA
jgi:Asp-tRNA(Asn)/Glu-tRNA(Gln) amidotransferase C subunit